MDTTYRHLPLKCADIHSCTPIAIGWLSFSRKSRLYLPLTSTISESLDGYVSTLKSKNESLCSSRLYLGQNASMKDWNLGIWHGDTSLCGSCFPKLEIWIHAV